MIPWLRAPQAGQGRWQRLTLLSAALAVGVSESGAIATLFPAIRASLRLTGTDLGVAVAANKLAGAIGSPFWLWLARRWSRKAVLVVSAGLWGGWGIAMGFVGGFGWLLALSCILAAGLGGAPAIITDVLSDVFHDRERGKAVGVMYGSLGLLAALAAALVGQLAGLRDGWRIGFCVLGGSSILVGLLIWLLFEDPGLGDGVTASARAAHTRRRPLTLIAAASVFRIPSFNLMLLSRLLSAHLVIGAFGVVFLTDVRHFGNPAAVAVLPPFGAGLCLGGVAGGIVADRMHAWSPRAGRVLFLQSAQFAFAVTAFLATQIAWQYLAAYMAWWFALGFCQGVNPGVNRPIVMSVIVPELRDWAFVVMLIVVEPIGWASYSLIAGLLGDAAGLQFAFLVLLVGVMLLNGAAITPLYWTYCRDTDRARMLAQGAATALLPAGERHRR